MFSSLAAFAETLLSLNAGVLGLVTAGGAMGLACDWARTLFCIMNDFGFFFFHAKITFVLRFSFQDWWGLVCSPSFQTVIWFPQ